jgi:hypothetical protein
MIEKPRCLRRKPRFLCRICEGSHLTRLCPVTVGIPETWGSPKVPSGSEAYMVSQHSVPSLVDATTKYLWENLGKLYQSKSLVNKLFLRKKLYNLRMRDGDSVAEHLNAFNTVVSQLVSVDIKISDEDKCISLLCSLPDSWDSLVVAIGSNTSSLKFEEVVSSLLSEEMRRKNMEGHNTDALFARGHS